MRNQAKEAAYAQGPWEYDGILIKDKDRKIIAVVQEQDEDEPELTADEIATAALMAAAPDLLTRLIECQKILLCLHDAETRDAAKKYLADEMTANTNAIAKAKAQ